MWQQRPAVCCLRTGLTHYARATVPSSGCQCVNAIGVANLCECGIDAHVAWLPVSSRQWHPVPAWILGLAATGLSLPKCERVTRQAACGRRYGSLPRGVGYGGCGSARAEGGRGAGPWVVPNAYHNAYKDI